MNFRAQASLEYLMTYGWALILIVVVAAVLVFIVGSPADDAVFSSSDPTKIMLEAGAVSGSNAVIRLQNITGDKIEVTDSVLAGAFFGAACTLNDSALPTGSSSVEVTAGGQIDISCSSMLEGTGIITIQYTDYAGLQRQVDIVLGGSGASADPNLVAYYAFSEGSGATADDSAGSNNGTLENFDPCGTLDCNPTSGWISGAISGNALSFDGGDDEVSIGNVDILKNVNQFTISAWAKILDNACLAGTCTQMVISEQEGGGVQDDIFSLGIEGNERMNFYVWNENGTSVTASSNENVGTNPGPGWHHYIGVFTGTQVLIYVNGVLQTDQETLTGPTEAVSTETLRIGSNWNGQIAEVKIWNRALSASEVCSQCNAFASCSC